MGSMSLNNMKFQWLTTNGELQYADSLVKDGTLIGERIDNFHQVKLYQLDTLYMEVYKHMHFNVIVKVITFTDTEFLEPYLEKISLQGILIS